MKLYKWRFRTNASFTYPSVSSYNWDGLVTGTTYNSGSSAFNTSGSSDNTSGYKWIVFKVSQNNYTTETISGTSYKYYDVKSYLENTMSFSSNLVSKIKDKDDNSAIGFIIQTYNTQQLELVI